MAEIIKDGRTGDTAKVDVNNRLHTQALVLDALLASHLDSEAYDVSTGGLINLDSDLDSALIYISNTGDEDLIIETLFIDSTTSTNGSGVGSLHWNLNPSAGTLIDAASPAQVLNRRIGSPINLSAISFKATESDQTFTGGAEITFPLPAGVGIPFGKPFIVPKGQSFGVSYKPPTGNTDMDIQVGLLIIIDPTAGI